MDVWSRWSLVPVAAVVLAVVTAPALAQEGTEEPTVEATEQPPVEDGGGESRADEHEREAGPWLFRGLHPFGLAREAFLEALADELDITVEELETAVEAVRDREFESFLDEQVAAGRLTPEQADRLREAREQVDRGFRDRVPGSRAFRFEFGPGGFALEIHPQAGDGRGSA